MSDSQDDLFREMFFEEARELLATLETGLDGLAEAGLDRGALDRVYRAVHSLKGAAAMVGYPGVEEKARSIEKVLAGVRTGGGPPAAELVRSIAVDRHQLAALIEVEERQFRERSR